MKLKFNNAVGINAVLIFGLNTLIVLLLTAIPFAIWRESIFDWRWVVGIAYAVSTLIVIEIARVEAFEDIYDDEDMEKEQS